MKIVTVSELTAQIKNCLESKFSYVTVQGEIGDLRTQSSGHTYFTLKDENAQISAVLFRGNSSNLARMPKRGDKVTLKGELSVYPPRGNYQLIVRELTYSGVGELLQRLHQRKILLQQRGWLSQEHKKSLPKQPKTIGVITSPTGAVIRDIIHILDRRSKHYHLVLYPVRVQGEGAAQEIANAIRQMNHERIADVLIIGRGGGSLEDLWAFNEEIVAEAIFHSEIPIISAVGHETDFTIADLVADIRAPTPSAAAEIVTAEKLAQIDYLERCKKQLHHTLLFYLKALGHKLEGMRKQPCFTSPTYLLNQQWQRLDEYTHKIHSSLQNQKQTLSYYQTQCTQLQSTIDKQLSYILENKQKSFANTTQLLSSINPKKLLTKGYCIPFREKEDSVILSSADIAIGERLRLMMHDGNIVTTVEEKTDG